ncbi:MAG: hypothetical protein ACLGHN_11735 [Bacteriovoracia bacterium]
MKLLIASSFLLLLLIGCNSSDSQKSPAISEGKSVALPLQDQLTDQELAELKAEGLLTDDQINEIKTFNK